MDCRWLILQLYTVKKGSRVSRPSRDVTTKLSLGGNNDVIIELFLPRGSLVSDIPAGDGKLVNLFYGVQCSGWSRKKLNLKIDTKAKCRHLKKLTCKGILWQVFIKVYRLETQLCWYLRPSFVNCCPFNLLSGSTLPLPCVNNRISLLYTRIQCIEEGVMGFRASDR